MKIIFNFFDKLEDNIRAAFSRHPIVYAFIGGAAIVLFWRGIWHIADTLEEKGGILGLLFYEPVNLLLVVAVLLATGLFVSFFVGDNIIISGLKKEKKLDEKLASEVRTELDMLNDIEKRLNNIEKDLKIIKEETTKIT